jgi:2-dehydro-3-deoxyphosphogluconate aldolase/(4S)-4-hydroxy-2-oxoglutarate aldolase
MVGDEMARFARLTVLNTMIEVGLVPVFHHGDIDTARSIVDALSRGGARTIEFTNRGDHAFEVFSELERHCAEQHPQVILGVGSVVDEVTAGMYINLGANFVVGPILDRRVAEVCNRRKVFPGGLVGGLAFVKSVLAPCPWALLMPTGGVDVTEDSLAAWFDAGVPCVGIGSKLVSRDLVEARDWGTLEQRTTDVIATISSLR